MLETSTPRATAHARPWWHAPWATAVALTLIVLLGAYFRTINLYDWDGGYQFHPDESFFTQLSTNVAIPSSSGEYFDSYVSPLNPRNRGHNLYVYGLLPVTLTRWTFERVPGVTENIAHVGRTFAVLFDLASIVVIFLIGWRIHSRAVGLLAALFAALAVMSIQQSHFYTVDTAGIFFTLLSLYWIIRIGQGGDWRSYVATGLSIGGAVVGGRITMATLGLIATVAALQAAFTYLPAPRAPRLVSDDPTGTGEFELDDEPQPRAWFWGGLGHFFSYGFPLLCVAGALTLLTFRVFQPDAFVGSRPDTPLPPELLDSPLRGLGFFDIRLDPRYLDNLRQSAGFASGAIDWPPSVQWAGRADYLFPFQNMVIWGMGLPLGLLGWFAWLLVAWQIVRRRWLAPLALWVWVAFYFGWQGAQFAKTMRYMLPIYGPLMLFAAWSLVAFWNSKPQILSANWGRRSTGTTENLTLKTQNLKWLPNLLLLFVVLSTLAWAWAFTRIYTRPHTRLTASRWLIENVQPGSLISGETWDYTLPVSADDRDPRRIMKIFEIAPYLEDDQIKYTGYFDASKDNQYNPGLLDQLEQAEYMVMSSNRVYDSIVQLPMRYPATIRFYRALFNGELGFELAADVSSYPTLLGRAIPDQGAEEAFSVYDHPRVLIYRKTGNFSREKATRLLTEDMNWGEVYKLPTVKGDKAPTALRFTPSQWPAYITGGTWTQFFAQGLPWPLATLFWLLILELLGFAAFALLYRLLPMLADHGFTLARTLALLLVAYAAWLLGSFKLLAFSPLSVWLCALPLLVAGGLVGWRSRTELLAIYRQRRAALLTAEGLYLAAFLFMLVLRLINPELWHPARGGEKPMDLAYLTATLKSASFPPYDPWHAGGYINYYYFGFVIVGTLIHLTGIAPAMAYNLAVPTIFALTALGAWGVVYNLLAPHIHRRPWPEPGRRPQTTDDTNAPSSIPSAALRAGVYRLAPLRERSAILTGLLAVLFVLLVGSLTQAVWLLPGTANQPETGPRLWQSYAAQQAAQGRPEWAFWDATRIIEGTVNEFPYFTFLFADLHAHMIVMPLSLAVLGLLVALVRLRPTRTASGSAASAARRSSFRRSSFVLLLLALLTGALRVTNTWDYPTFTGITLATLGLVAWRNYRSGQAGSIVDAWLGSWPLWLRALAVWLAQSLFVLVVGNLLFAPFTRHFVTESSGIELWRDARTPLWDWLRINGLWLFVLITTGLLLARRYLHLSRTTIMIVLAALLALVAVGLQAKLSAPILLLPLLAGTLLLAWSVRRASPRVQLPLLWAITGLALSLGVDLIVVKGDVGRLNTVFKFGLHSWVLFALASAVALPFVWSRVARWRFVANYAWRAVAVLLVAAALVFPLTATPARLNDRYAPNTPLTLDGAAFMRETENGENGRNFALKPDYDAIAWIQSSIEGSPVMLEAHLPSYRWGGRISIYTGLPTLLGWEWHQIQQRSAADAQPVISNRQNAIAQIYSSPDLAQTSELLRVYGVQYVYVGELERALYDASGAGITKFETLSQQGSLEKVYERDGTRIYRVANSYPNGILTTDLQVIKPSAVPPPSLLLYRGVAELPAVNEYAWNGWASSSSWLALLVWLVVLYALTLLGLPLAALLFRRWRDGGWAWARLLGLLLLGYAVWLPVSLGLLRYNRLGLAVGALLVLALNAGLIAWLGARSNPAPGTNLFGAGLRLLGGHLRAHLRPMLLVEGLFLAGFLLFVLLRALNPDLWQPFFGGEKPMEFGFLNAILRSPVMPPYEPFYSGGYINYYYYGLYLVSLPIKATGIHPAIAFNLVIPTLFALTLAASYALVAQLTRRVSYGLLGAAFLTLLGNLAAIISVEPAGPGTNPLVQLLSPLAPFFLALREQGLGAFSNLGKAIGDAWFWGPSRVIPGTINEFPFWSFLFADLHPHLVALPITLLVIAIGYTIVDRKLGIADRQPTSSQSAISNLQSPEWYILLTVTALTLGTLAVTNSWDFPTYGLLIGVALLGRAWRTPAQSVVARLGALALAALTAGLVGVGSLVLYTPFFDNFYAFVRGIGRVPTGTTVQHYFVVYGLLLAMLLPAFLGATWRLFSRGLRIGLPRRSGDLASVGLVAPNPLPYLLGTTLLALCVAIFWQPAIGLKLLLGALILAGAGMLLFRRTFSATWYTLLLATIAWAVSLGVELIYIRDHLAEGEFYRMNTVFKFGVQIGTLLTIAAVASLPRLLARIERLFGPLARSAAHGLLACLVALGLVYPFLGTASRLANRFATPPAPTLDGLAFLRTASFNYECSAWGGCQPETEQVQINLAPDGEAISWLNQNIIGTPVVLQSDLWFYRAYGVRVAANTGLPTVVSGLHVNEQRNPNEPAARSADVATIYNTSDPSNALRLLARYNVNYVYVGAVEQAVYSPAGLQKFDTLPYLSVAYQNPGVRIYKVEGIPRDVAYPQASFPGEPAPPPMPLPEQQPAQQPNTQPVAEQPAVDLATLEEQARNAPADAGTAFALAQAYRTQARFNEAADALAAAAAANPNDVALYQLWGDILTQADRRTEATAAYNQAIATAPTAGNINKLGAAQLSWGELAAAKETLSRALLVDANAPDPHFFMGSLHIQEGDNERARRELERYLELAPNGTYVGEANKLLATLP